MTLSSGHLLGDHIHKYSTSGYLFFNETLSQIEKNSSKFGEFQQFFYKRKAFTAAMSITLQNAPGGDFHSFDNIWSTESALLFNQLYEDQLWVRLFASETEIVIFFLIGVGESSTYLLRSESRKQKLLCQPTMMATISSRIKYSKALRIVDVLTIHIL